MAYRFIAADMDGTLLNSASVLTEPTKSAILQAVEKGIVFTISTGRPMRGVENINQMFAHDLPFITFNGAVVVMGKSKQTLFEQNLLPEDAKEIIRLGKNLDTAMMIWTKDQLYVESFDEKTRQYQKISGVEPLLIDDIDLLCETGVTKILWYDDIPKIEGYQTELAEQLKGRVNCHTSRPMFLEFVDIHASKALAMEKIGQHFGIKQSEMIAIGDGYNDISMLEYAGLGVAMANAPEAVKDKADFITLSNDEDGVAQVINQFIFGIM